METWTDEDWDSWDESNPVHMKLFFQRVSLQYIMRREVGELKKRMKKPSKVSTDYLASINPVEDVEEQDAPPWLIKCMAIVLLIFAVSGLYLICLLGY